MVPISIENVSAGGLAATIGNYSSLADKESTVRVQTPEHGSIELMVRQRWHADGDRVGFACRDVIVCNVCDHGGSIFDSPELSQVASNVRKFKDDKFTVWRCRHCDTLHSKEPVDLDYYYEDYPMKNQKADFFMTMAHGIRLRRLKKSGLRPHHKILDYGCGVGHFIDYLRAQGFPFVSGYDRYVTQYSDRAVLAHKFDFVVSQDFIEHVEEPAVSLRNLCGHLKEHGTLCVGTVDAAKIDLGNSIDQGAPLHQPYHRHILSYSALVELGRKVGLSAVKYYDRWYYNNPLVAGCNGPFIYAYTAAAGDLDSGFEPIRVALILRSPKVLARLLFGFFFRDSQMMVLFKRTSPGGLGPTLDFGNGGAAAA